MSRKLEIVISSKIEKKNQNKNVYNSSSSHRYVVKQNKRSQREQNKIYYKERKFLSRNLVIYYLYKLSLLEFFYSNQLSFQKYFNLYIRTHV